MCPQSYVSRVLCGPNFDNFVMVLCAQVSLVLSGQNFVLAILCVYDYVSMAVVFRVLYCHQRLLSQPNNSHNKLKLHERIENSNT